ncbi:uncharacterized protein LY89DRAFT_759226 [Mollisia scopiformis]|uniref:Uncharacterized protein n=1 Tax=Mollisia scopiformis TaxID=149040 RepID=A0A194WTM5_MOLSC|nr:uncharacterized protein LY89DRAFT_759226 [Mollisia scopiformis]KUJ11308.1 hypothetical protein LY89DRAFT_759226 [Mollisia scopiformis]
MISSGPMIRISCLGDSLSMVWGLLERQVRTCIKVTSAEQISQCHSSISKIHQRSQSSFIPVFQNFVSQHIIFFPTMYFSGAAIFAAFSFATQVFAAPSTTSTLAKRSDFVTTLQTTMNSMSSSINSSANALNASAASNGGKPTLMTSFTVLGDIGGTLTNGLGSITQLIEDPIIDFSIEEIQVLVEVLDVWAEILEVVEGIVDAVVNAFFPGLVDEFKPFIQIWINVVDAFTNPFLDFYSELVGTLTGSPELAAEINDYIAVIEKIRDDFLLSF